LPVLRGALGEDLAAIGGALAAAIKSGGKSIIAFFRQDCLCASVR
jgi:hypothetical protein